MSRRGYFFTTLLAALIGGFLAIFLYVQLGLQPKAVYSGAAIAPQHAQNAASWWKDSTFTVPEGLNFILAAERSTPAVVHIRSTFDGQGGGQPLYNLFRDYFNDGNGRNEPSPERATGSGVFISADGYIITNHHVVEDAEQVEVTLWNDQRFEAEIIGLDPTTDLALIKVDGDGFPFLSFADSDEVKIGEWVLAVGNPFDLTSTVTAGIVSAKARNINILGGGATIESFIQTDAAVNPGNSGGALVNLRGELVGVNTAIASRTGSYVGYSFAVPANLARKVADDLQHFGEVQRALLGVRIINVSDLINANLGVNNGVYINSVSLGSSADDAGLQEGDVIVGIDGKPVRSVAELQELVGRNRPGDEVEVSYVRSGEEYTANAVLKNTQGTTEVVTAERVLNIGGAAIENLTAKEKQEYEVRGGVKITAIEPGPWQDAGIQEGFIITSVDKLAVNDLEDLDRILQVANGERLIVLGLEPNGDKAYFMMDWR